MQVVDEFRQAARNSIDAGFDGVEIHAANVSALAAMPALVNCWSVCMQLGFLAIQVARGKQFGRACMASHAILC